MGSQGEHNNMYDHMKEGPRPQQQSWAMRSLWIVYYRKRRRKSSEPQRALYLTYEEFCIFDTCE